MEHGHRAGANPKSLRLPGVTESSIVNIFRSESDTSQEVLEELLAGKKFRVERIVSTGQTTPAGEWYDQADHEWVVLLTGAAKLQIEGRQDRIKLLPGDAIDLPAHCRHRIEWTDPSCQTVWLAIHYTD
ncbi:MAG: cupin 2 domain-containing protein [Pirellulaceae bacterium]|jgi:cupin 2 domain-containing protein